MTSKIDYSKFEPQNYKNSNESSFSNSEKTKNIDYDKYSPDNYYLTQFNEEKEKKDKVKSETSFLQQQLQEFASSPPVQTALGLSQAATSPLDLMKMYFTGEALAGLDEAYEASEREGKPFDYETQKQKLLQSLEYFPTQQLAEQFFTQKTGIETQPQDRFTKFIRGFAELAGFAPKGAQIPKIKPKQLTGEAQELRNIGQQHNLTQFAGMEAENAPKITPIVSEAKEAGLRKELQETSKKAVEDVIDQKIPIREMREKGINLEDAYTTAYDAARTTASKMGNKTLDINNIIEWINHQIVKTKASAPSLSNYQKTYINVLKKEKANLLEKEIPKGSVVSKVRKGEPKYSKWEGMLPGETTVKTEIVPGKRTYPYVTPEGKLIKQPTKKMSADQALNQYKNFNDNVKGIYRKPEFAGSENAVKNAYAGLNEQLINAIEKASPELAKELKFANKIFHETSKLEQVEGILSKAFKDGYDPKKLHKVLGGKRDRKFLQRNLGKQGVKDLEKIAFYGKKAEEKVFQHLKNPKTVKEYLSNMTPLQLGLLVGFKSHAGLPIYIGKSALQRGNGLLLTRKGTKNDYIKFMKEASHLGKNPAPLFYAGKKLEDSIKEEFGSDDEFLDIIQNKQNPMIDETNNS